MDVVSDSIPTRVRKIVEGIGRMLGYGILRAFIHSDPVAHRLDVRQLESLLIIPYGDAIGDMIVASPIWRAVKSQNPKCRIGVITSVRNESLLVGDTDVDMQYRFSNHRDFRNWSELRRARKDGYQVVLNLHFTHLTDYGLISSYIGPRAIKITADHERREKYQVFFNHIGRRPRHTTHLSIHSLELLNEVVEFDPPLRLSDVWPSIVIPKDREDRVEDRIVAARAGNNKYLVIHTQAGTKFREWGIANSFALAERLAERFPDFTIFLTAAPMMQSAVRSALENSNSKRVKFFETSSDLLELAAFVKLAALVVTPETSITHFASALHVPVVTMMSNRDHLPVEWMPIATPARMVAPRAGEPVETILIDTVFEAAESLLTKRWRATQSALDVALPSSAMLQAENADRPLIEFQNDRITTT